MQFPKITSKYVNFTQFIPVHAVHAFISSLEIIDTHSACTVFPHKTSPMTLFSHELVPPRTYFTYSINAWLWHQFFDVNPGTYTSSILYSL